MAAGSAGGGDFVALKELTMPARHGLSIFSISGLTAGALCLLSSVSAQAQTPVPPSYIVITEPTTAKTVTATQPASDNGLQPVDFRHLITGHHRKPGPCPCPSPCPAPALMPVPEAKKEPEKKEPEKMPEAKREPVEAPAIPEPTLAPEQFAAVGGETVAVPNMIGDLLAPSCARRCVTRVATFNASNIAARQTITVNTTSCFFVPAASHTFKIGDDGNVMPQDRIFFDFNYYSDVNGAINRQQPSSTSIGTSSTGIVVNQTGNAAGTSEVYREVFGLEKTFLGGLASVEMRLPLNMLRSTAGADNTQFNPFVPGATQIGDVNPTLGGTWVDIGDLTFVLKGLLWANRETGSGISTGLAVTLPTSSSSFAGISSVEGDEFNGTVIEPFFGYLYCSGNFWFQGFFAVDVPVRSDDFILMYNDIGAGYFIYRSRDTNRILTGIAPTVELHINTPLNHEKGTDCPIDIHTWVDLTTGFTCEFFRRSTLALGISTPVTGPRPYDIEAIAQLNIRF
jgi:hypothetical protein